MHLDRHVGHHQPLGLQEQRCPLGPVGQAQHALVNGVEGRQLEARQVLLPGLRAVTAGQRLLAVGRTGRVAQRPHLQRAGLGGLHVFGPLLGGDAQPQPQRLEVAAGQLVELARDLAGLAGLHKLQRATVRALAQAVTVAVDVAVHVEQGAGARQVELAHLAAEGRVIAGGVRQQRGLRHHRLATPHQADLAFDVHAQRNRPTQRHLVGRVAAHHRIQHVEVGQCAIGRPVADGPDAALGQVRRDHAAGQGEWRVIQRQRAGLAQQAVELAVEKGQPARLVFGDHGHLHLVDHRQPPALETLQDGLALGIVGARLTGEKTLAVARVARQHHHRAAPPLLQHKRAGAHRVGVDLVAVELHHFARLGAQKGALRQRFQEARPRLGQRELQRVPAQRAQAGHRRVVVERLAVFQRPLTQRAQADDALAQQGFGGRAVVGRVDQALEGQRVVVGHHLTALALEGRVVGEEDAGLDVHRPDLEIGRHLGQRGGHQRHDLAGPGQRVEGVQRLEDVRGDGDRVQIADARRIEPGLRNLERHAQHLACGRRAPGQVGAGCSGGCGGGNRQRTQQQGAAVRIGRGWHSWQDRVKRAV